MRQVTDYKQPIIVCELKKKVPTDNRPPTYLIPELCIVTGLYPTFNFFNFSFSVLFDQT